MLFVCREYSSPVVFLLFPTTLAFEIVEIRNLMRYFKQIFVKIEYFLISHRWEKFLEVVVEVMVPYPQLVCYMTVLDPYLTEF